MASIKGKRRKNVSVISFNKALSMFLQEQNCIQVASHIIFQLAAFIYKISQSH